MYSSGLKALHNAVVTCKLRRVDPDFAPEVIYVYGGPGSGKSRYVCQKDPEAFYVPEKHGYKWKDGYSGQDTVVYANISPKNLKRADSSFLKEIDRYFIQVPVRGGYIGWRPKRIYLTSVYKPCQLAKLGFSHEEQFLRRITHVVDMEEFQGAAVEQIQERRFRDSTDL
jgi:hypothetical protein